MITDTVGQGGKNYSLDVARVQKLLNQNLHHLKRIEPLAVDGMVDDKTIQAIKDYQQKVLKLANPSGLIEPDRNTIKWLSRTALKPRPQYVNTFIIKTMPVARQVRAKYHIPISVLIAQAALDSDWGRKIYNQAYYRSSKYYQVNKPTDRHVQSEAFDHFATLYEAAENFGHYIKNNPRYLPAFRYVNQPLQFAKKLQEIGATDIYGYVRKLHTVMTKYQLTEFDR